MTYVAGGVVVASGLWLVVMAAMVVFRREHAARFLMGFASTARAHYTEQALRIVAAAGFVIYSPHMALPVPFAVFGWLVGGTSLLLVLLPWRWHKRFGEWAVPMAVRHIRLYALGSFALGATVLWAVFWPMVR